MIFHCKQNNHNGLKPKSWVAEIRSLSYTLSHCRNDIEIWWVCGKVFLLHSMKHERFTLLIYNNIKKTQLYSPHELSLKTEPRHERGKSNKRYLCWFTVSIPVKAYQILFKKTWAYTEPKKIKYIKNAFDKKIWEVIRGLEDIFVAFCREGYMNKNHFAMRLYPWVL